MLLTVVLQFRWRCLVKLDQTDFVKGHTMNSPSQRLAIISKTLLRTHAARRALFPLALEVHFQAFLPVAAVSTLVCHQALGPSAPLRLTLGQNGRLIVVGNSCLQALPTPAMLSLECPSAAAGVSPPRIILTHTTLTPWLTQLFTQTQVPNRPHCPFPFFLSSLYGVLPLLSGDRAHKYLLAPVLKVHSCGPVEPYLYIGQGPSTMALGSLAACFLFFPADTSDTVESLWSVEFLWPLLPQLCFMSCFRQDISPFFLSIFDSGDTFQNAFGGPRFLWTSSFFLRQPFCLWWSLFPFPSLSLPLTTVLISSTNPVSKASCTGPRRGSRVVAGLLLGHHGSYFMPFLSRPCPSCVPWAPMFVWSSGRSCIWHCLWLGFMLQSIWVPTGTLVRQIASAVLQLLHTCAFLVLHSCTGHRCIPIGLIFLFACT